eukprot:CAMPEP_0117423072 /NCGR_PEP_ID=MMETSP0758-20121206/3784_1 /TAXON_ID=63605 /ORGANISM="Percolomonas cosmopolitus, Strain AE-1 (ATCC 50343)" /LENGTH=931 /DNA_ID=CAMNT_0005206071 /DNA_START=259 /DNA_END=3054 /DNA_ORIENTATION=-
MEALAKEQEESGKRQDNQNKWADGENMYRADGNKLSSMDPEYQKYILEKRQKKAEKILRNKKKLQRERVNQNRERRRERAQRWKRQVERNNRKKRKKEQLMQQKHEKAEQTLQEIQQEKAKQLENHCRIRTKKSNYTKQKKALMERSENYQRDVLRKEREKRDKKVESFKKKRENMYVSMKKLKQENAQQRHDLNIKYRELKKSYKLDNDTILNELGIDLEEAQRILASPPKKRESMLPSLVHPTPDMRDEKVNDKELQEPDQHPDDDDVEEEGEEGLYDEDLDSLTLRTTVIAKSRLSKLNKYHPSLKSRIQSLPYNNMEINKLAKIVKVKKASNRSNGYGTNEVHVRPNWNDSDDQEQPTGEFTITLKHIDALDTLASLQPKEIRVTLTLNEETHESEVSENGEFGDQFTMNSDSLANDVLLIEVKEQDNLLGKTSLALLDALDDDKNEMIIPLESVESDLPNESTITVICDFVKINKSKKKKKSKKEKEQAARVRERELEGIRRAAAKHRKREEEEEKVREKMQRTKSPIPVHEDCFSGSLTIKVIKAMYLGLPHSSISAFVKITIGEEEKRTSVKQHTLHPSYNQSFKFKVEDAHQPIHITVYDEESSTILGTSSYVLESVQPYLRKRVELPVDLQSGEEIGTSLLIECQSPDLKIPPGKKPEKPKRSKSKMRSSSVQRSSSTKKKASSTKPKEKPSTKTTKPAKTTQKSSTSKSSTKKSKPKTSTTKKTPKKTTTKPPATTIKKLEASEDPFDDSFNLSGLTNFEDTPVKKKEDESKKPESTKETDSMSLLDEISDNDNDAEGDDTEKSEAADDDNLDDFLKDMDETLQTPNKEKNEKTKVASPSSPNEDDLDDFLNDIDSSINTSKKETPKPKEETNDDDDDLDLDNFMDDIDALTAPSPKNKASKKKETSFDDIDLDNFDIDNI